MAPRIPILPSPPSETTNPAKRVILAFLSIDDYEWLRRQASKADGSIRFKAWHLQLASALVSEQEPS